MRLMVFIELLTSHTDSLQGPVSGVELDARQAADYSDYNLLTQTQSPDLMDVVIGCQSVQMNRWNGSLHKCRFLDI